MHRMVFVQITHGAPQVGSDKQKLFELLFLFLVYFLSHVAATKMAMRKSARDRSRTVKERAIEDAAQGTRQRRLIEKTGVSQDEEGERANLAVSRWHPQFLCRRAPSLWAGVAVGPVRGPVLRACWVGAPLGPACAWWLGPCWALPAPASGPGLGLC
jgi:hypothetical protein